MFSTWMKKNEDLLNTNVQATAFVVNSAVIRGALTAILWLTPMRASHRMVGTLEEAEAWVMQKLEPTRS